MASVQDIVLTITERQDIASVEVSYKIAGDARDVASRQPYRELVFITGVNEGPGEFGPRTTGIRNGRIFRGVVTFTPERTEFLRTRTKDISAFRLDEDQPLQQQEREDEIRAQVSLSPIPLEVVGGMSNIVRRRNAVA